MSKYDNYSREDLIALLHIKNKQIDSQRSMLFQSRATRDELHKRVKQESRINATLSRQIEKLAQRSLKTHQWKTWSMKEFAAIITNTILAYNKLKNEGYVTDNEMFFMILAHQKEYFFQSTVLEFNKQWGRNPGVRWRNDLKACCDARYFGSAKTGRKRFYYLTIFGRERLESLLRYMYQPK